MERMLNDYKTTGREVTDRIDRELAEHRRDLDGLQKRIDNRFVPAHQLANLALARLFLGSVFEREDWSTAGAELVSSIFRCLAHRHKIESRCLGSVHHLRSPVWPLNSPSTVNEQVMKLWRDDGLDLNDLVIAFNTVSSLDFPEDGHPSDLSPQTFNDIPKLLDWHLDTMPLKNGQDRRTALVTLAVVVRCMSVPPLSFEGARFWRRFKALDFTHPEISIPPHMSANGHSNGLGIGLQFGGHSRA